MTKSILHALTTVLHVIGALTLLASLDPTLTRVHAENFPLQPFKPAFNGCPPPNTSTKSCLGKNRWETTGVAEGTCGYCGVVDYWFNPGTCSGSITGGGETPICRQCAVTPGSARDVYSQVAAPQSDVISCFVVLFGTGVSLTVAFCLATAGWGCVVAALGIGTWEGKDCYMPLCMTNCVLMEQKQGDPVTACSR